MNKISDQFIGKLFKVWVDRHKPPVNARARLLAAAANNASREKEHLPMLPDPRYYSPHILRSDECAQVLLLIINETVFRSGFQMRVI